MRLDQAKISLAGHRVWPLCENYFELCYCPPTTVKLTKSSMNSRNISEMPRKKRLTPSISLWFCGMLNCPNLCCDWS